MSAPAPQGAGKTTLLKGGENCPRTHQLIVEAFQDNFTGSTRVGKLIADGFVALFAKEARGLPLGEHVAHHAVDEEMTFMGMSRS